MVDELQNLIREMKARGNHQDAALSASAAKVPNAGRNRMMSFPVGARVLDLVTGKKGTVTGGRRDNVVIPNS